MKRFINIALFTLGVALLGSCTSTGSAVRGSDAYGYYNNPYYYGYPNYYQSNPYYQRPIIRHNVIVIPEQRKVVRSKEQVRRRQAVSPNTKPVSPNTRRKVAPSNVPSKQNEAVKKNNPTRRSNTVAPSSRRTSNPTGATRTEQSNRSRRGNN